LYATKQAWPLDNHLLTRRQSEVIPYFVGGGTIQDKCERAGISKQNFYQWIKLPAFKEKLKQEESKVIAKTLSSVEESIQGAFLTLRSLLNKQNENVKARSADSLLNFGIRLKELEQVEQRLKCLEDSLL
jgi:hypothetical protein